MATLEDLHRDIGGDTIVLEGKKTKVTENLVKKALVTREAQARTPVLERYRKMKGIVVKKEIKK